MPTRTNTADTSKNSKGAGMGNAQDALKAIKNYLTFSDHEDRQELITNAFLDALCNEGFSTPDRSLLVCQMKHLLELDKALDYLYGDGINVSINA